jgi:hypothetical protein
LDFKLVLIALALVVGGCATLTSPPELAFQAVNAVDWSQTLQTARSPGCYRENDSAWAIGEHPSERSVAAAWAVQAGAHLAVSAWLDREVDATDSRGWRVTRAVWQVATIGIETRNVVRNANAGLRPFGGDACKPHVLVPERK